MVDVSQLNAWYTQALENCELRNRIAVSGFNISKGAFGSIVPLVHSDSATGDHRRKGEQ